MSSVTTPSVWTVENVFKPGADESWKKYPPYLGYDHLAALRDSGSIYQIVRRHFSVPFLAEIECETNFDPVAALAIPPTEAWKEIGEGAVSCPVCEGHGEYPELRRGRVTGIEIKLPRRCFCQALKTFAQKWDETMRFERRFKDLTLAKLAPDDSESTLSLDRQAQISKLLRQRPTDSYFLFGEPNTGKTHFLTALYRKAVWNWSIAQFEKDDPTLAVWRSTASVMLEEHHAWATRNKAEEHGTVPLPKITTAKIQTAIAHGFRPCLYLDEIDKIAPTGFKLGILVEIVNAVYAAEGQVVATSNKSVEELAAKWGSDEAGTVLRRIGAGRGAYTIRFA